MLMPSTLVLSFEKGTNAKTGLPQWQAKHPDHREALFVPSTLKGSREPSKEFPTWECNIWSYPIDAKGTVWVASLRHPAKAVKSSVPNKVRRGRKRMDPSAHASLMAAKADRERRNSGMEMARGHGSR